MLLAAAAATVQTDGNLATTSSAARPGTGWTESCNGLQLPGAATVRGGSNPEPANHLAPPHNGISLDARAENAGTSKLLLLLLLLRSAPPPASALLALLPLLLSLVAVGVAAAASYASVAFRRNAALKRSS